jgi:hypothetical protein
MSINDARRGLLQKIVGAAIVAATPISLVRAAGRKIGPMPARTIMELADGKRVEIVSTKDGLLGRVLDAKGRVVSTTAAGTLKLKSGKTLTFDKTGRLIHGQVADQAFLLECDPPPAKCPP